MTNAEWRFNRFCYMVRRSVSNAALEAYNENRPYYLIGAYDRYGWNAHGRHSMAVVNKGD